MNQNKETNTDILSVIAEPGALTFVTRKEWRELPEMCLGELAQHESALAFYGTSSVFFLLRNINPADFLLDHNSYKLVRISIDEEGKQVCYVMNLSRAEGEQLRQNRLTIWE